MESAIDNSPVIDIECYGFPFLASEFHFSEVSFYQLSQNHLVDLDKSIIVL